MNNASQIEYLAKRYGGLEAVERFSLASRNVKYSYCVSLTGGG